MAFGFIPNGDGFAPSENIRFKALVKSDVVHKVRSQKTYF
jgi:hypothetical protein